MVRSGFFVSLLRFKCYHLFVSLSLLSKTRKIRTRNTFSNFLVHGRVVLLYLSYSSSMAVLYQDYGLPIESSHIYVSRPCIRWCVILEMHVNAWVYPLSFNFRVLLYFSSITVLSFHFLFLKSSMRERYAPLLTSLFDFF